MNCLLRVLLLLECAFIVTQRTHTMCLLIPTRGVLELVLVWAACSRLSRCVENFAPQLTGMVVFPDGSTPCYVPALRSQVVLLDSVPISTWLALPAIHQDESLFSCS